MTDIARLSIVLSAYNEEEFIEAAVQSILRPFETSEAALHFDLEVVVIDDHSTDRTVEILEALNEPRLRILRNPTKGKVQAYNFGLQQSTGQFVILFAGDDLFNVSGIMPRLEPIRDVVGPAATFCALQAFRDHPDNPAQRFPKKGGGARAGGAIAMNRAFVDRFMPIPVELPNEDSWMCLHADYLDTYTVDIDVVGMWYRLHDANTSGYGLGDAEARRAALLARSKVYIRFLLEREGQMTDGDRRRLSLEIAAHAMAATGNTLSILFLSHYPVFRRVRAAFLSRNFLWKVRVWLGEWVSGLVRA